MGENKLLTLMDDLLCSLSWACACLGDFFCPGAAAQAGKRRVHKMITKKMVARTIEFQKLRQVPLSPCPVAPDILCSIEAVPHLTSFL